MPKGSSQSQMSSKRAARTIAVLVDNGSNPFEMSVALEIFGQRRPELGFQPYDVTVCAPSKDVVMRDAIFAIRPTGTLRSIARADTLVVPNRPDPLVGPSPEVLRAVARAYQRGTRIISLCTGTFTMAAAGILTGHRVTTHWRWVDEFAAAYPEVELQPDVLYVDDGQVLSAAGSAAALDLCLHVVRSDWGSDVAHSVSRRLVFGGHRDGGQRQFVERPAPPTAPSMFRDTIEWATANLDQPITVAALAERSAMSVSTFHRRFVDQLGVSPLRWLHAERIELARRLLETTALDISAVATTCGFGTPTNLRTHFRRRVGLAPSDYRQLHG